MAPAVWRLSEAAGSASFDDKPPNYREMIFGAKTIMPISNNPRARASGAALGEAALDQPVERRAPAHRVGDGQTEARAVARHQFGRLGLA